MAKDRQVIEIQNKGQTRNNYISSCVYMCLWAGPPDTVWTHQLFIVVRAQVPHVNSPTLVPHNESGLVRVETHTRYWGIHLKQTLALLRPTSIQRERETTH